MTITVIGAGITGITTAYYLARSGYDVLVVDQERYPGMGTSYANGGQLSASNAEVWNSWHNVAKAAKWMFRKDAPLKINPAPSLHKYSWFAKFLSNIPNREKNTFKTCEMAIDAHDLYKNIAEREGIDFDCVKEGILHIYSNDKDIQHARETNVIYQSAGLERREVTSEEVFNIEPQLSNSRRSIVGGFYTEEDFTGDIHKFCANLARCLETRYAVQFVQETVDKESLELFQKQGPVIVCAGTGSRDIAKMIGDSLAIYPVKGYSITVNEPGNGPWVSLLDDETKIVSARLGDSRFRAAGTAEFNGYNRDILQHRIKPLIDWTEDLFPQMNTESVVPWAGLRPMTPNMMPIVKQSKKNPKVWYNTGHGHLGWTLSAYTAIDIANKILYNEVND